MKINYKSPKWQEIIDLASTLSKQTGRLAHVICQGNDLRVKDCNTPMPEGFELYVSVFHVPMKIVDMPAKRA